MRLIPALDLFSACQCASADVSLDLLLVPLFSSQLLCIVVRLCDVVFHRLDRAVGFLAVKLQLLTVPVVLRNVYTA